MEYITLGKSGLKVSKICFGSLTVGPLQANLPIQQGAEIIAYAFENNINFIDTAQLYNNYEYIKKAMEISQKFDVVVSSKTYAYTRELAVNAVEEARQKLNREYIDIFMLHEQESIHTLRGHMEALEYFLECRQNGIIRAIGASMHHVAAVEGVCDIGSSISMDVIHPIFNMKGLGIVDGTVEDMRSAMARAKSLNIGVFSMKPLGGGNLHANAETAFDFVLDSSEIDAVAIGMQSIAEVDANIEYFEKREFSKKSKEQLKNKTKHLHIEDYCVKCGNCVTRCHQKALSINSKNNQVVCDTDLCLVCGYCSTVCEMFAIKII